jgi:hypothetical protein
LPIRVWTVSSRLLLPPLTLSPVPRLINGLGFL